MRRGMDLYTETEKIFPEQLKIFPEQPKIFPERPGTESDSGKSYAFQTDTKSGEKFDFQAEICEKVQDWQTETLPILTASVSLLLPPEEKIWKRIRKFYLLQKRCFLRYCQRELFPDAQREARAALENSIPPVCVQAELHAKETYHAGKYWSVCVEERETGLPGGIFRRRWGDTWDMASGYPAALGEFFPSHSRWRKQIPAWIAKQAECQYKRGETCYYADYPKRIKKYFHPRNFYLTESGIAVYYPMYALGPAEEGVPVFVIPWQETAPAESAVSQT